MLWHAMGFIAAGHMGPALRGCGRSRAPCPRCCQQLLLAVAPIRWATALRRVKTCHRHVFIPHAPTGLRAEQSPLPSLLPTTPARCRSHSLGNCLAAGKNVPPARFYPARPYGGKGIYGRSRAPPLRNYGRSRAPPLRRTDQMPSFSRALSFRAVQKMAMACSSSLTGGNVGAMRILLSLGSMP